MKLFPIDISLHGFWVDRLFNLSLLLTGLAFLTVLVILVWFLIRYRARPGHKAIYHHGTTSKAVLLIVLLEVFEVVAVYGTLAYNDYFAWDALWGKTPDIEESLQVHVTGERFAWTFFYPGPDGELRTEDDLEVFELHVPQHQPVILSITSRDVLHSLFIPNIRKKMDAVPGLTTSMHFVAIKTGTYDIACAEFCGSDHHQMGARMIVHTPEEFTAWLGEEEEGW